MGLGLLITGLIVVLAAGITISFSLKKSKGARETQKEQTEEPLPKFNLED